MSRPPQPPDGQSAPPRSDASGHGLVSRADAEKILALATALEQSRAERADGALPLAEVEAAAAEAGIDPARVREAAALLAARRAGRGSSRLLGAPTALVRECEVAGELPESYDGEWTELVRRLTGGHGHFERAGRSATWWTRRSASVVRVTVTTATGLTRLRVAQSHGEYALGVHIGMAAGPGLLGGGAAAVTALVLGAPALLAAGVAAGLLGGSYALGRQLVRRGVGRDAEALDALLAALADFVAQHVSPPPTIPLAVSPEARGPGDDRLDPR